MARKQLILNIALILIVLGALALWPTFVRRQSTDARAASLPTAAPVIADYKDRDKTVAFWEGMMRKHLTDDMMSPRKLAEHYLQRYRETGDIDDVLRAKRAAEHSLVAQPRANLGADAELASVDLTLHKFKDALAITKRIEATYDRNDPQMQIREASLDLELGDFTAAKRIIDRLKPERTYAAIPSDILITRYDELTGHLADARHRFERPAAYENSQFDLPAQQRAWFYFRSGELAFEAGDNDTAIADEETAKKIFPNDVDATRAEARFACALHRWHVCLDNAIASANVIPYPETLGYEADAQRALGDETAAKKTEALIVTVERIGNAQHISDRLLAIYYSEHGVHLDDAYRIAKSELAVRHDVFTQDTLAWAAAMDGRWDEARRASALATRYGTENSLILYHAGVIAEHFGNRATAKDDYARALALNASFHPTYADDARARLAKL